MYFKCICDLGDQPAYCLKTCSFKIVDFSVNALCLLIYGFQGLVTSSFIFCLSSGGTFGSSNNLGNNSFLYCLYINSIVCILIAFPRLFLFPHRNMALGFPGCGCS